MDYILYFFIFSLIGWVLETIYASLDAKKFVSKQTLLKSPICPIYGLGAIAILVTLRPVSDSDTFVFCGGFFVASSIEYLIAKFYECKFNVMWWDYRKKKGNFEGKVAVDMSILWGIIAILFFKFMFPAAEYLISLAADYEKLIISIILTAFFLTDYKNTLKELEKYSKGEISRVEGKFAALRKIEI